MEVFLFDWISTPIAFIIHKLSSHRILPYLLTVLTFALRSIGGLFFFMGWINTGIASVLLSMIMDGVDGKVSRSIFGEDPELRGTSDFILDFLSMGGVLMGMGFYITKNQLNSVIPFILYIVSFLIFMSFLSTKFRLYSLNEINPESHLMSTGEVDSETGTLLYRIQKKFKRYRLIFHPSSVDSEFLMFVLFPFFGFNSYITYIAIAFLWIDLLFTGAGPVYLLTRTNRR